MNDAPTDMTLNGGPDDQLSAPQVKPNAIPEPIAVIGLGCRLAGDVSTAEAFWDFLLAGGSAVREVPADRWEPYLWRDPRNAAVLKDTTPWGTFIDNLAGFDAEFFGVSPREAELMDPQQRLALEVSWEALEHAGVPPRSLAGSDTAVLMGVNSDDYGKLLMEDLPGIEAWTGIGTSLCGIANRVSHLLDLRGPSVALDAACAASLVAVHQACQLLRSGETTLALAGGVSALIGPGLTRVLDQAGATAPDGRCKTFDAAADGYGRGEGAAVVVLKRLADAMRDGDRVLAVVRGGAVAQDGRTVGIMSPNGAAQADLFRLACRSSAVDPATVDFIEAHGTGTPTGDPVEVGALAQVYGAARPDDDPALVGSVKPNTGHLEGGAGAVGLIKAVLALHHGRIPPTAGVRNLTPSVDWAGSGLRVPTVAQDWPRRPDHPRRAAVCSYGYGGTIAHVLLEEAPPATARLATRLIGPVAIPLSGRSESRLSAQAAALAEHLDGRDIALTEVAATLWARRSHEPMRAAVVAAGSEELLGGLRTLADGGRDAAVVRGTVLSGAQDGAVWVFSGHGSHWPRMGQELLAGEPAFAAVIDAIDPIFGAELGFSARVALTRGELGGTDQVQALTFAMQVGLAAVLRERGVRPAAVIGHSVGEVAACVTAGVFDLAQGAAVACYRARGFRKVMGQGAMALVPLPFADAQQRLGARSDVVAAISASLTSTVISGTVAAVEEVAARWAGDGLMVRRVRTDVAFHSPAMDALTADLARLTGALPKPWPARIPLYTTALADPRSSASRGPDYWVANLRDQVRFAEAVSAAAEDGHRLFLEVSAHPVVSHSIAETLLHLDIEAHAAVGVLRRDQPARRSVAAAVAALHCYGAPVAHGVIAATPWAGDLPGTQWQHRDFWRIPSAPPAGRGVHDADSHTLLGGRLDVTGTVPARVWETRLDMSTRPYPGNHPVQGTEIVPAAVLLNTFLTATETDVTDLTEVHLRTPVAPGRTRDVQVVLQDQTLAIATRLVDDDGSDVGGWLTHCTAVAVATDGREVPRLDETAIRVRCTEQLPPNSVVDKLAKLGVAEMGFGWEVVDLWAADGEFLAQVRAEPDGSHPSTWAGLIDAATSVASTVFDGAPRLRMPARIERVRVVGKPSDSVLLHVRRRDQGTSTDVTIASLTGRPLVEVTGMTFEELENSGGDIARVVHRIDWKTTPFDATAVPAEVVLVGGDPAVRAWCERDLKAAGVAHRVCATPADVPADLDPESVVLVLPRASERPIEAVETVLETLKALVHQDISSRLWTLTQGVHEGADVSRSPLWGLSRVAATEHPTLWGGVLDLAEDRLPLGALTLSGHAVVVVRGGVALTARMAGIVGAAGPAMECSPAGTYLVTGGTGVLGLRIAERLADLGARRVLLLSRSGLPERSQWASADNQAQIRAVAALEERGVWVHSVALDIAAPGAADELRSVLAGLPPVRGVIHAAGVEAGVFLVNTTIDEIAMTMRPKVDGALVLHEMFPPGELDWLVLYSSCGYLAGFPGQGAYACGNAFLDALARHRRGLGDVTTSVAWTAWRGLGMGSDSAYIAAQLDALGMDTVGADDALRALDVAMRSQEANPVVLPVLPEAASVPILADIAAAVAADSVVSQQDLPVVGPGDMDTEEWVSQQVLTAVAAELGLPADSVDTRMPLVEIGVDSIMTVALRRQLEKQTGLALPPTLLWEHPTAAAVTARIVELLDNEIASAATEDGAPVV